MKDSKAKEKKDNTEKGNLQANTQALYSKKAMNVPNPINPQYKDKTTITDVGTIHKIGKQTCPYQPTLQIFRPNPHHGVQFIG